MTIKYSNGRTVDVDSTDEAERILQAEYPDLVILREDARILYWADDEQAGTEGNGDDGSRACAAIYLPACED